MYGRPVKTPGNCHVPWKPWAWHPRQPSSSRRNGHQQRMGAMPTALRGHAGDETAYRELVLAAVLSSKCPDCSNFCHFGRDFGNDWPTTGVLQKSKSP